jgi:GPH family glycoside/pentoside/hexuronide:cation symporter
MSDYSDFNILSGKETFTYVIAMIPQTILSGIFVLLYVNFFWDNLKLQQTYFVIGSVIYMIVNSLNDFFLGRLSDKTNVDRWGSRRLIYIKWGGPLWALVFFLTWFPWSYENQIIIFIHFVVSICAFDMFLTLVILVWMALLPELTENLAERNKIQFLNQIFGTIGALPVILALIIFENNLQMFQIFAGVMALISGVLYYIIGSSLHERPELYKLEEVPGLLKSIKETLKSRSFITYVSFNFFNYVNLILGYTFVFAYLFIFGFDLLTASMLFILNGIIFGWMGSILYMMLAKKIEMQTLIIRGRLLSITISVIGFLVVIQPGADLLIWLFFALGTLASGYNLFNYPYLMLVTDEDEVTHGFRREGMFLGTNAFFIKFGDSVAAIIGTSVLIYFGFIRNAPSQPPEAIFGIKFLFFIVPAIMNFCGLICIYFFPLHGKNLKEMRTKLKMLHDKKTEAYKS